MPLQLTINKSIVHTINPGDPPGSISSNKPGKREVYLFECARNDEQSTLFRSRRGVDVEISDSRIVMSMGFEKIRTLMRNDRHDIVVTTEEGIEVLVRFEHR